MAIGLVSFTTLGRYEENGRKTMSGRIRGKALHLILFTDHLLVTKKSKERRPFTDFTVAGDAEEKSDCTYTVIDHCKRHFVEFHPLTEEGEQTRNLSLLLLLLLFLLLLLLSLSQLFLLYL